MHKKIVFANESGENMNENWMLSQLGMLYEYIMNGLYRFPPEKTEIVESCATVSWCICETRCIDIYVYILLCFVKN